MALSDLFMFNMVTLDGFFAGPTGDIDWHTVDAEFNDYAIEQLGEIGALVFGRVTYELMASYWPTVDAGKDDPVVASAMNALPKLVVSRTLREATWQNATVARDIDAVAALKRTASKRVALFGSADLGASLMERGLIDEYRLIVSPIVLGAGKPLFKPRSQRAALRLTNSRVFGNGNVLLCYRAA